MANRAKVHLLGADELIAKFRELDRRIATDYVSAALKAGTEVVYDAIERAAPHASGTLKSEIQIREIERRPHRVVWGIFIGPRAFYWRFLQYGTRFISAVKFISKSVRNRRGTARQTIRDTFRDKMGGF